MTKKLLTGANDLFDKIEKLKMPGADGKLYPTEAVETETAFRQELILSDLNGDLYLISPSGDSWNVYRRNDEGWDYKDNIGKTSVEAAIKGAVRVYIKSIVCPLRRR